MDQEAMITAMQEHRAAGVDFTDDELDYLADTAISIVKDLLSFYGEENVAIDEYLGEEGELILNVTGGDLAIMIGRHGRTLESFQLVVSTLVNEIFGFYVPFTVDIEGYKRRRKAKIQDIALSAANKAMEQGRDISLPPMPSYERRLVHIFLREYDQLETVSEGVDPDRYVVIRLK
jgi:spoIIIJ-associated protein